MVTCSGFIEPLNLQCILVNLFAGTSIIFLFVAFISIAAVAGAFRMRNGTGLIMLAIFGILFSQFVAGLYLIIILIAGFISFSSLKKLVSR